MGGKGYCVSGTNGGKEYSTQFRESPIEGGCGQIKVEFFNNTTLAGTPAYTGYVDDINFTWASNSPAPGVNADFSGRFTSYITAPYTGTYTFYGRVDDRQQLWVNNVLVIDRWTDTWGEYSGTISLTAGQIVPIKLQTLDTGGGAVAQLSWAYGSQAKIIIPASTYSRSDS